MSENKKFLDLVGLTAYDVKIKKVISKESEAGKAADVALKTFLGDPASYPDENIPLYSDTVNDAADAKAAAIDAKAAAIDAKDSALNSAAAASASAQTAADILGTSADTADKNTVYGVYAKAANKVDTGLIEIDTYVNDTTKPAIDSYVETTTKPAIDSYVETTTKPAIDEAKTDAVDAVNNAKTTALGEITVAVKPVTDAKDAAEVAQAAAEVAQAAAETAADTATNAVTGFRAELGNRPNETSTVWDSISELKSATAGGVHFAGVINSNIVPDLSIDESDNIIGYWSDFETDDSKSKEFNVGDIIILVANPDAYPNEPTKEYILVESGDAPSGYDWVELGDVNPANEKIAALESTKLNKSALVTYSNNVVDLEADAYISVELSEDDYAIIRTENIPTITSEEINELFA